MTAAVGYIRVSTVEQAEHGYSLNDQRNRIKTYCAARDWPLVAIVGDHGFSGADAARPGLEGLLAVLEDGNADVVVVTKLDRLSRSAALMLSIADDLEAQDVAIVSITEAIDTTTPAGKLFRTVLAGVAEFEKELITERLVSGKRSKQRTIGPHAYIGGPTIPFGFRAAGEVMVRDPIEWPVVARILKERSRGLTLTAIAEGLNRDGLRGKRGGLWHAGTLSRLLRTYTRLKDER